MIVEENRKWTILSVVAPYPTPYAVKALRMRSREIDSIRDWTEMFDPLMEQFWYLNRAETSMVVVENGGVGGEGGSVGERDEGKRDEDGGQDVVVLRTRWDMPDEFRDRLVCLWSPPPPSPAVGGVVPSTRAADVGTGAGAESGADASP